MNDSNELDSPSDDSALGIRPEDITEEPTGDIHAVSQLKASYQAIVKELGSAIVGQDFVIENILTAMLAGGHCLLVGVPGLAKTLMIRSLADILDLKFTRVQFTPDLMPSDITGTEILRENKATNERELQFVRGPVFTNILLADEINRTPPKTQAALLEAMQERHVTVGGRTLVLEPPFFTLATQNPIEQEGTYPLPEAQLDRFMFFIKVDYPNESEEFDIIRRTTGDYVVQMKKILSGNDIIRMQHLVRRIPVADHVIRFAMTLSRKTRPDSTDAPSFIKEMVAWGAGPRAGQSLVLGAKARAALNGRFAATIDDVVAIAHPTLRHRVITNFNAEAEGVTSDTIIDRLLKETPRAEGRTLTTDKMPSALA
ncbi:MAG: MoxR family ATPase [Planctomycetota bacterium]